MHARSESSGAVNVSDTTQVHNSEMVPATIQLLTTCSNRTEQPLCPLSHYTQHFLVTFRVTTAFAVSIVLADNVEGAVFLILSGLEAKSMYVGTCSASEAAIPLFRKPLPTRIYQSCYLEFFMFPCKPQLSNVILQFCCTLIWQFHSLCLIRLLATTALRRQLLASHLEWNHVARILKEICYLH